MNIINLKKTNDEFILMINILIYSISILMDIEILFFISFMSLCGILTNRILSELKMNILQDIKIFYNKLSISIGVDNELCHEFNRIINNITTLINNVVYVCVYSFSLLFLILLY